MTRTKGGNIILRRVSAPNQVAPGETFEVEVDVSNGAAYINPWDPDKCGLAPPGYKIEVVAVGPNGTERTKEDCITTTEVGTRDETYTFTFRAPSSAKSAAVDARVRMRGSGKETGPESATITVDSRAPEETDTGSVSDSANQSDSGSSSNPFSGGGFGGGSGGGSPLGPNLPSGNAVLGIVALLGVAWLASSAEGVVG